MFGAQIRVALVGLVVLAGRAWSRVAPPDMQHVNGTLVRVEQGLLHVRPSAPRAANTERVVAVDPGWVKITKNDIDFGGVTTGTIAFSQLRAGDPVTVTIENGVTVAINVNTPPAVNGVLTAVGGTSIGIRMEAPAGLRMFSDEVLAIDPQRTQVTICKVQFGPTRKAALADLRIGQPVMILAKDRTAYVVHVLPVLPVFGTIRAITSDRIVLGLPGSRAASRPAERTVPLDPKRTEVFEAYMGEPVESAGMAALVVGMVVGVSVEEGRAVAIIIPHDAVSGTVIGVGVDSVTIELPHDPKVPPARQTFGIDAGSKFLLGRESGRSKLPNGKTRTYYTFEGGAGMGDLKVGQWVSITAKKGRVMTMRITPRATTQPSTGAK